MKHFDMTLQAMTWAKACPVGAFHSRAFRHTVRGISLAWLLPSCFAQQVVDRAGPYLAHLVESCPSIKESLPRCFNDIASFHDRRMS